MIARRKPRPPLACRLGLHKWFTDAALIRSARACNYCPAVASEADTEALKAERQRISALPTGATLADMYLAALGVEREPPNHLESVAISPDAAVVQR